MGIKGQAEQFSNDFKTDHWTATMDIARQLHTYYQPAHRAPKLSDIMKIFATNTTVGTGWVPTVVNLSMLLVLQNEGLERKRMRAICETIPEQEEETELRMDRTIS